MRAILTALLLAIALVMGTIRAGSGRMAYAVWEDPNPPGAATGYVLYCSLSSNGVYQVAARVATTNATVCCLGPQPYWFRATCTNATEESDFSPIAMLNAATNAAPAPGLSVGTLRVQSLSTL